PERLGGCEINDELELRRLLDWDIAWLHAAENLVNHISSTPKQVREARTVGHETPGFDQAAAIKNRRQPRAKRKGDDVGMVGKNESITHDIKRVRLGLERHERVSDVLRSSNSERGDFEAERACRRFNLTHFRYGCRIAGIKYDRQVVEEGNNLA